MERPVIFSEAMVLGLLHGRKTQTRRLASSPLAKAWPGDVLWVREAHSIRIPPDEAPGGAGIVWHRAGNAWGNEIRWRPSIHMPRWACRLELKVTDFRRQPLQAITDLDAEAEGVQWESADPPFYYVPGIWPHSITGVEIRDGARACFAKLWTHLHGAGSWEANPEVVALTFTVRRLDA